MSRHPNNPNEIARETLKTLASSQIPPTPEHYARVYQEISGQSASSAGPESVLTSLAQRLSQESPRTASSGKALKDAVIARDWDRYKSEIENLLLAPAANSNWANLIRTLMRQLETTHKGLTLTRKKESLEHVLTRFASNPDNLHDKLLNLLQSWSTGGTASTELTDATAAPAAPAEESAPAKAAAPQPATVASGPVAELLSRYGDLLAKTIESALPLHPDLKTEITQLSELSRTATTQEQVDILSGKLRHFWTRVDVRSEEHIKIQEGLIRLLRLLVENVSELVSDDKWLHGQIASFQEIIANPIDRRIIFDAERGLRDVIIKQGLLKQSLADAKATLKTLMSSFIDRLGTLTDSTGEYHKKMENYSRKIVGTDNLSELGAILEDIMQDTRTIQTSALRSHEELLETRKHVEDAEERIRKLEQELEQVSEKVREDQLTGVLNRRGLDEIIAREFGRADRNPTPVSLALLDIDNFKKLNDSLGHQAGDQALIHLTKVVKETLRPSDAVGRYGGEEFIIILPDTDLNEAEATISRLQRELTKRFFLHDNKKLLITFSAGVALRGENEEPQDVIMRADKAMYEAKHTGKNRVVVAD
jgi:diguanylate cyclase